MQKKQRVLVTGATGTLGSALVAALVAANHHVVANYCHDEARAEQLARTTGSELARADVSDEGEVEKLFEWEFDAVFHLAGISHDALLLRLSVEDWGKLLSINLLGSFLITRAALRTLPVGGRLVLVSSRVGERGFAGQSAYGASKAALLGLMKSAAAEGREKGIAVNAVCPGFAPSKMSSSLSEEVLAKREAENWLPKPNAVESFSAMCLFLLKANGSGKVLHPDCRI
jgi:NAD(P)-dependent dehydrogenase (short-subunit alcohol dehydrogenase family)